MMPNPVVRIRLTSDPRDFRPISAAAGMPLLDRHKGADSLLRSWLGRFVAEPTYVGEDVAFFVRDERGRPVSDLKCELVSPAELRGTFRKEFDALKARVKEAVPSSDGARTLQQFVLEGFSAPTTGTDFVALGCQLFKYLDHDGVWKLVWCAGLAPSTGKTCLRPTICRNPDCRRLITGNIESLETAPCPACSQPLLEPQKPRRTGRKLAVLVLLLAAIAAGGGWYYTKNRPGALIGRVTTADGRPVPKARVRIADTGSETEADADGRFRIEQAGRGMVTVEVAAAGFRDRSTEAILGPNQETAIEVPLVGGAQIVGRVIYRWAGEETPIVGAHITASTQAEPLTTDVEGRFRVVDLAAHTGVKLDVSAPGFRAASSSAIAKHDDDAPQTIVMFGDKSVAGSTIFAVDPKHPVAQAEVTIIGSSGMKTRSDAAGRFKLLDLPPVEVQLQATFPGMTSPPVMTVAGDSEVAIPLKGRAVVEGEVVRRSDDTPLADIEVRTADMPFTAKSDAQGKFRLEGLPEGTVNVRGAAPGLVGMVAAKLTAGEPAKVKLALSGGATLRGRVVAADSKQPVPQASVRIADTMLEAKTDAEGKFEFAEVPESATSLFVSAAEFVHAKAALKLSLGEHRLPDVELAPGAMVQGRVVGGTDKHPLAGAEVKVVGREEASFADKDGKFSIGPLPLGSTRLRVMALKSAPQEITCEVTRRVVPIDDVALPPLATLVGRVVRALDKRPLAEAQVEAQVESTTPAGLKAKTDKNGEFRLEGVPLGPTSVKVSAPGYLTQTIAKDVAQIDVSVDNAALVGDTAATGIVVDAVDKTKAISGAVIDVEIGDYKTSTGSGAEGKFLLGNVPTGPVKLTAVASGYRKKIVTATVSPTAASIEVPLERLLDLEGVVVVAGAAARQAVPNAKVVVSVGEKRLEAVSGADGSFKIKGLEPGNARVEATAAGFERTVIAEASTEKWLEIPISSLMQIRGRVHAADRPTQHVAGARVTVVKGANKQEALTNGLGEFVVELSAGELEVTVEAPGFFTSKRTLRADAGTVLEFALPRVAEIKGYAVDATTNKAVSGVTVEAAVNEVRETVKTDERGIYAFPSVPAATATLKFTAAGYESYSTTVAPGEGGNVRAVLCPKLTEGTARIVLTWAERPRDLDVHVFGTGDDGKPFHMSFDQRTTAGATLDIDDKDGFGPETCTLKVGTKSLRFYVAHPAMIGEPAGTPFADSMAIAHVYVFGEKESREVRIPAAARGPVWHALELVRSPTTGAITLTPHDQWLPDVPKE